MKELILRTLTGILLILVVAGSMILGPIPFLAMVLLVFALGGIELMRIYPPVHLASNGLMIGSGGLLILLTFAVLQYGLNPLWIVISPLLWAAGYCWGRFQRSGILWFAWLAIPLAAFYGLGWIHDGLQYNYRLPLAAISMIWISDTFAYLAGSLLGKHPLTPRLSPRKTWEGFVGGLILTTLGGWVVFKTTELYNPFIWILISMIVVLFGLMGDLFESNIKRKNKLKDTGGLLPGHGGILDRFDSLFFVAPVLLLFLYLIK